MFIEILKRSGVMLGVLLLVSFVTFFLFLVICNPVEILGGKHLTPTLREQITKEWKLDQPLIIQFGCMLKKFFTDELKSQERQQKIVSEIFKRFSATLSLAIGACIIWMLLAIIFASLSAIFVGTKIDKSITFLTLLGISMPSLWIGAMLSYYLGFKLDIFPYAGYTPISENFIGWLSHLVLPCFALSVGLIGIYSRILRTSILEMLNSPHVIFARASGLPWIKIYLKYVLRNSLVSITSLWGLDFGAIVGGGAIAVEVVFDLKGVGQYAAESIRNFDMPVIMGATLFGAFFIVIFSAIVDILYKILDPRTQAN